MSEYSFKTLGVSRAAFAGLETFPAPGRLKCVTMESDEVTSLCPVTGQPDYYHVRIMYMPSSSCIESKSLKLYFGSMRGEGVFCEALADRVLRDVEDAIDPKWCQVVVTQKPRGGIGIEARASST